MSYIHEPVIEKMVDEEHNVYYTVYWSLLKKADKYEIISSVPSTSGFFELYYMDEKKKLVLFYAALCWYGGLRNTIRTLTDPELEKNKARKAVLEKFDCYYRFSLTNSFNDLTDVLYFFSKTYFPGKPAPESSGRYTLIFVNENSPDKIVTT